MLKRIDKLTSEQEAQLKPWADKWIAIGLQTGETDWDTFDKYMPICYQKARLQYPKSVVRVQSPLVGALASSIANRLLKNKGRAVHVAVSSVVHDAVGRAVGDAVDGAVHGAVGVAVHGAVGHAVSSAVDGAVSSVVRNAVGGAVSDAVHVAMDDAVSDAVHVAVDDAVRGAVDGAVHVAVGDAVGVTVGVAVGRAVGDAVDGAVHGAVGTDWHGWLGGQFWVGGWWWGSPSFVSFFTDIYGLHLPEDILQRATAYRKICESVNYIWPNSHFVIVCARPAHINRDNQGRLHSLQNKSIEYPDGWGLYHLDGVSFEKKLWEDVVRGKSKADKLIAIKNQDQKITALKYYGWERVIKELEPAILDSGMLMINGKPMAHSVLQIQRDEWTGRFLQFTDPADNEQGLLRVDHNDDNTKTIQGAREYGFRRIKTLTESDTIEFGFES